MRRLAAGLMGGLARLLIHVSSVGCFFLFVAVYAIVGIVVWAAFGPGWGLLASVLAPACGYAAVRMGKRVHRIGGALEGYRAVRRMSPGLQSVLEARGAVLAATVAVIEQHLRPAARPSRDRTAHGTAPEIAGP